MDFMQLSSEEFDWIDVLKSDIPVKDTSVSDEVDVVLLHRLRAPRGGHGTVLYISWPEQRGLF